MSHRRPAAIDLRRSAHGLGGALLSGAVLLPGSAAIAQTEAAAGPTAEERLALPACRAALGLPAAAPSARLLQADPELAARIARTPACADPAGALRALERLEKELDRSRQRMAAQQALLAAESSRQEALARDLAALRRQLTGTTASAPGGAPAAPTPAPAATSAASAASASVAPAVTYTPGQGFSLQAGESRFSLKADARLLGFSSTRYTFNPGQPLVVSPKNPDTSYDLSAQQSTVTAAFQGPRWGDWTPSAFALFTLQDNLLAEGYSFTPVVYYGAIGNGGWRVSAGQNFDLFAPRDPDTLPSGKLAASGNPGSYRPQFQVERRFGGSAGFGGGLQLAISSPITTSLPSSVDLANLQAVEVVEDNGWPNVEGRLSFGFGAPRALAGGRQLRPAELGLSGVVGQLRVLDDVRATDPLTLVAGRSTVDVWGVALDGQVTLGRNVGLSGELYTGQALGEYLAGIFQTYNRTTNEAVPTAGGWGQLYVYVTDSLRFNLGYGIDNAQDAGRFSLKANSAAFANVVWDVNPWLQLGLEGNYRLTTYDSFGDKNAWLVITEVLFRL